MNRSKSLLCVMSTCFVLNAHADLTTEADVSFSKSFSEWKDVDKNNFSIWQGFDHAWQRYYVFPNLGITPHRISSLKSLVRQDESGIFAEMGQKTGVDGDYMSPKLFYTTVRGAKIDRIWTGSANLKWTDRVDHSKYPSGQSRIKVPLELPAGVWHDAVVALQGVDISLFCNPANQTDNDICNSNGAWPTNFRVALVECDYLGNNSSCYLSVDFDRAWTPGRGGFQFPPFFNEIKEMNYRLDFDVKVKLGIYQGPLWSLLATRENVKGGGKTLQTPMTVDTAPVNRLLVGQKAATVITGMSFKLSKPEVINPLYLLLNLDPLQTGRYLASLAFNVGNPSGTIFKQYSSQAGVWSPVSVMDAIVDSSLTTRFITFPLAASVSSRVVTGKLCNNSTNQAPWFSKWERCSEPRFGPEQAEDKVRILTQ